MAGTAPSDAPSPASPAHFLGSAGGQAFDGIELRWADSMRSTTTSIRLARAGMSLALPTPYRGCTIGGPRLVAANRGVPMASETSPTGQIVRAAVVQAASVAFDREATLDKVADWTAPGIGDRGRAGGLPRGVCLGLSEGRQLRGRDRLTLGRRSRLVSALLRQRRGRARTRRPSTRPDCPRARRPPRHRRDRAVSRDALLQRPVPGP